MTIYLVSGIVIPVDEPPYMFTEKKTFVNKDAALEYLKDCVIKCWVNDIADAYNLSPADYDKYWLDDDDWEYISESECKTKYTLTTIDLSSDELEKQLHAACREEMYYLMQTSIPGYNSARLCCIDLRGQCLSFEWNMLPDGSRERFYVDLVCNMPDMSQIVIGHTINKDYSPKDYDVVHTLYDCNPVFNVHELMQLCNTCKSVLPEDAWRKRAYNPWWLVGKEPAKTMLEYMDIPYAEYCKNNGLTK